MWSAQFGCVSTTFLHKYDTTTTGRVVPCEGGSHSPEGGEHLVVDALEHVFGRVQLDEEHDEDAVIRQLLELRVSHFVVLQQNPSHDAQHLHGDTQYISAASFGVQLA